MRVANWRTLLSAAVAASAFAAGAVAVATTANAAPSKLSWLTASASISDGAEYKIVAKSPDGARFYLIPTGELRSVSSASYTFVHTPCGKKSKVVCYEIQDHVPSDDVTCMFYWKDFHPDYDKISYDGACGTPHQTHKWYIDSLDGGGVRFRPVSDPNMCLVYDPARLPAYLYTFIELCSENEVSETRFWFQKIK